MGTEIAIPFFGPLIVIGVAILIYLAISGRRHPVTAASPFGIGRSRLALGYLGVFVFAAAYSYWDTLELSRYKVAQGHVTSTEAAEYFWGWYLNLFCLSTPLIFFVLTVFGLPLLSLLRRYTFLSILGATVASQIVALLLSLYVAFFPYNDWCRVNSLRCAAAQYTDVALLFGVVAVAFAVPSRLPWLKGLRHAS